MTIAEFVLNTWQAPIESGALAPRRNTADRAWGELGLADAAAAHATTMLAVLPLATFLDANVYPVVVWDRRALLSRLTRMDGPAVSTDSACDLLDRVRPAGYGMPDGAAGRGDDRGRRADADETGVAAAAVTGQDDR